MRFLQVTTTFLLLSSLCTSQVSADVDNVSPTSSSPTNSAMKESLLTPDTKTTTESIHPTPEISIGTTSKDSSKTSLTPEITSLTTAKTTDSTTLGVTTKELITTNKTGTTLPLSDAASTSQSFQHTSENQSSIKMTTVTVQWLHKVNHHRNIPSVQNTFERPHCPSPFFHMSWLSFRAFTIWQTATSVEKQKQDQS
ncbi:PREDICTED: poly(A) polymerase-like [Dipodomys ordii]|uniref:Poly(A) polymerase-like n=1 Tax=Dipodomys ordii TaxID=10020 RepID=A0A1S3FT52_DIPOR|nr:PREDICTED: poly(A) polymerase-like [Dipodomys ordii]